MQVLITDGPARGLVFPAQDRPLTIGRDRCATIRIDDHRASRQHAVIEPADGSWVVRDLGSTNQTYLNGTPVAQAVLKDGDLVRIGNTTLRFCLAGVPALAREPAEDLSIEMDAEALQASLRASSGSPDTPTLHEVLYELSQRSQLGLSPHEYLEDALPVVARALAATTWAWLDVDSDDASQWQVLGRRADRPLTRVDLATRDPLIARVLASQQGFVTTEIPVHPGAEVRSAIAVPLPTGKSQRAVLYVDRCQTGGAYGREELERLAVLGMRIAGHLENLRLYGELQAAYEQLRNQQHELIRAEKMAAIGRLASSFAHDLNNPLGSLLGFLELASKTLPARPPDEASTKVHRYLEKAVAAAHYCRALSLNLLSFAREKPVSIGSDREPFSVRETVQRTVDFCQSTLQRSGAAVHLDIPEALVLEGSPATLQQVVVNLVTNSADALEEHNPSGARSITIRACQTPAGIELTVADNGPGIPSEIAERVFEPLFTTKDKDRGTGLGLFVVRKIVHDSGGTIAFHSAPGCGTTFTICLPRSLVRLGEEADSCPTLIDLRTVPG